MKVLLFIIILILSLIFLKLSEIWDQIYEIKTIVKIYFDEFEKNTRKIEKNTRGSEKDE
jgi:uncharacterized protein (DUF2225 family)